MSILEEQIEKIVSKQWSVKGFVNYLLKTRKIKLTKNGIVHYFLEIDNKILKFINNGITNHLPVIDNLKLLEFVNPIFDME